MSVSYRVTDRADIARLLAWCQQHAPHRVPLLEAVYHSVITLAEVTRDGPVPTKQMDRTGLPAIIIVGDDDGVDTGPSGWARARKLTRWARHGFIHATGGDVPSYRMAVMLATTARKLVLVETGSEHVMAWHRLFANAGVPTLNLVPCDGGVHPVPVRREGLH